jgi:hypothetical protein
LFAAACCEGSEGRGELGDGVSHREGDEAISLSFFSSPCSAWTPSAWLAWRGGSGSLTPRAHDTIVSSLLCIRRWAVVFPRITKPQSQQHLKFKYEMRMNLAFYKHTLPMCGRKAQGQARGLARFFSSSAQAH